VLKIGQVAEQWARIVDDAPSIPESTASSDRGSVLQKTIAMLYSDIVAASDQLLDIGADLEMLSYLKKNAVKIGTLFLNGEIFFKSTFEIY
jgi:hypothetical protein